MRALPVCWPPSLEGRTRPLAANRPRPVVRRSGVARPRTVAGPRAVVWLTPAPPGARAGEINAPVPPSSGPRRAGRPGTGVGAAVLVVASVSPSMSTSSSERLTSATATNRSVNSLASPAPDVIRATPSSGRRRAVQRTLDPHGVRRLVKRPGTSAGARGDRSCIDSKHHADPRDRRRWRGSVWTGGPADLPGGPRLAQSRLPCRGPGRRRLGGAGKRPWRTSLDGVAPRAKPAASRFSLKASVGEPRRPVLREAALASASTAATAIAARAVFPPVQRCGRPGHRRTGGQPARRSRSCRRDALRRREYDEQQGGGPDTAP
jgi:hypothetical protein